jgi:hypothetical protein
VADCGQHLPVAGGLLDQSAWFLELRSLLKREEKHCRAGTKSKAELMSNGIDFVIGGKDQAKPAMSSVEKSLTRLEQKTDSLKKSTLSLSKVTGALAAAYVAVKAGVAIGRNR